MKRRNHKIYYDGLNEILDHVFDEAELTNNFTVKQLAEKAGLGMATVYNLRNRYTEYPQFRTVFLLARAVGLKMEILQLLRRREAS
jgi:transcriptional regulator with XRE-family HTH domain